MNKLGGNLVISCQISKGGGGGGSCFKMAFEFENRAPDK